MTTSRTIPTRGALAALLVPLFVIAGLALDSVAQASTPGTGCAGSYGWPVKPFDRAHPVRGGGRVTVECGNGRTFQYWHIEPAIRVGQRAVAGQTLLGFVLPKREHVHLTQLEDGRAVNPLAPRRLAPYSDATVPAVNAITIRRFRERLPRSRPRPSTCPRCPFLVGGTAFPRPRLSSRGGSKTPQSASSSERASRATSVEPFRRTIASGTRSLVGHTRTGPCSTGRKERGMTGRYIFKLAARPFDTSTLRAGRYVAVVTAQDTAGNRDVPSPRIRRGQLERVLSAASNHGLIHEGGWAFRLRPGARAGGFPTPNVLTMLVSPRENRTSSELK